MISERTLKRWRKEALVSKDKCTQTDPIERILLEFSKRILQLTQELLDQQLLRKDN